MDGLALPPELSRSILDWDEADVHLFFSHLGFSQYEAQLKEHGISGDVLNIIDADGLKDLGVSTVGQRLAILKAVYHIKLAQNVPVEADHYIPPSETDDVVQNLSLDKLYDLIRDQGERLRSLEQENDRLSQVFDDWNSVRASQSRLEDSPLARSTSFKWTGFVKPQGSPTKLELVESPHPSPHRLEHDLSYNPNATPNLGRSNTLNGSSSLSQQTPILPQASIAPLQPRRNATLDHLTASTVPGPSNTNATPSGSGSLLAAPTPPKPVRQESSDNLKSFKVSLEDPAWKVLPAALRKYKINNDDWQNYAMFICYGQPSARIERCLSYDEKPLLLFQKLKDAQKNPVFMLKHIKDIRSPIAVAQQKQAARKASGDPANPTKKPPTNHARTLSRPPRLQVHAAEGDASMGGGAGVSPGSPDVMSPAVDHAGNLLSADRNGRPGMQERLPSTGEAPRSAVPGSGSSGLPTPGEDSIAGGTPAREVPVTSAISYAVAIYPYMAEQDDEFDVVVGDTFVIISRARGWWVVQRDPNGSGQVDSDTSKQGWVPAGCLLETRIPVATAIAEAAAAGGPTSSTSTSSHPSSPLNPTKTPILPLNIVSTSFPGYALMDYKKKGEEELDLIKDDQLRVFKRYNHWSYAVKEDGGERGWVPSWYIGKVTSSSANPTTPGVSNNGQNNTSVNLDDHSRFVTGDPSTGQQPSPMSSAFPPQARATTVL